MYILDPSLEGDARKELIDRFTKLLTDNGAQVDKVDEWGKRRLAYPIDFKNEGYYVLINFRAESTVPREIERNLGISEMVIRSMIVKIEEKRSSVKPRPVQVRPPVISLIQPAPVEAPAAPPEPAVAAAVDAVPDNQAEKLEPIAEVVPTPASAEATESVQE
jgi:small subunit ribosomal protein S6